MHEINNHLLNLVENLGLELCFVDMKRSGFYFAEEKTIFLNNELLNENSDFEVSHELAHCIIRGFVN